MIKSVLDHTNKLVAGVFTVEGIYTPVLFHNKFKLWTIPVGKVEINETPQEALEREMLEELGVVIKEYELLISQTLEYNNTSHMAFIYRIHEYDGDIKNKEPFKHRELFMARYYDFAQLMDDGITDVLKIYLQHAQLNSTPY
jgi:ADP-ribose pyrophosphatase YjhB (NUDIX family)